MPWLHSSASTTSRAIRWAPACSTLMPAQHAHGHAHRRARRHARRHVHRHACTHVCLHTISMYSLFFSFLKKKQVHRRRDGLRVVRPGRRGRRRPQQKRRQLRTVLHRAVHSHGGPLIVVWAACNSGVGCFGPYFIEQYILMEVLARAITI